MLHGLSLMNSEELNAVTSLIGIPAPLPTEEAAREAVITWVARIVKGKGKSPQELERTVLAWTASCLGVSFDASIGTDDLERAIRLKLASDAAEYLAPSWSIVCALLASGKKDTLAQKLTLMEQAVSVAVPSRAALSQKRREWDELVARWSNEDPRAELEPLVETVASRSSLGQECLTLGLALSLLDGGIAYPTERLYKELADQFGMNSSEIDRLQKRVNDLYWQYHNAAATPEQGRRSPVAVITEAARQTVYGAGALEALATSARSSLISSMELEPKSGWSRLVGGLSGMNPFFSNKLSEPAEAVMARVVYHTILKQHAEVAPEIVLPAAQPPKPATPANPAAPPATPPAPGPLPPAVSQATSTVPAAGPPPPAVALSPESAAPPAPPSLPQPKTTVSEVQSVPPALKLDLNAPPPPGAPAAPQFPPAVPDASSAPPALKLDLNAPPANAPSPPPAPKPTEPAAQPKPRSIKLDL